jgi:predicted pyridoxine 5'-phosphate oxidase superfamily flavin-nucleotide-binding protein
MKRVVLEQKLGFIATVCPDGTPNLSPKGTTTVWDDEHLLFADIASPNSIRNLALNPAIEINVVDPFVRKGYRFKGTATLHSDDDTYERALSLLAARGYNAAPARIKAVALVRVERAAALISPAYDGGAREGEVRARWIAYYDSLHQAEPDGSS